MIIVKDAAGTPYDAPKHHNVYGIIKFNEKQTKRITVNYSYFQPNGGADMSSTPKERVYFVVKGSITVTGPNEKHVLNTGDSIYIGPGEEREMTINGGKPAEVLVFMVTP